MTPLYYPPYVQDNPLHKDPQNAPASDKPRMSDPRRRRLNVQDQLPARIDCLNLTRLMGCEDHRPRQTYFRPIGSVCTRSDGIASKWRSQ